VAKVLPLEPEPTVSISVPTHHTFLTEFVEHNTSYLVSILQRFLPRAINEYWGMRYAGGADMLSRLRDGFDDETYAKTRDEFSRVHLLAIDDLGANKQVTDWPEDHSDDIVHHG
jgi:hypothetical protein